MAIRFEKIRWRNLLSTGNVFTEINLNALGSTLIVGENGAGKSTILDALTFALFGKPFRNINKPQLLNTITNKDLLVELEFGVGKSNYLIRRGIKPAVFEVYCNNVLLNQDAESRDYQNHLEQKILKTNYKSFCQVVVLGSASFVPFMQLPAAQRRTLIEDLLDLQAFTTMNVLLKAMVQENLDKLTANSSEQMLCTEKIRMLKAHLREMQSKSEQFIKEKMTTREDLLAKLDNVMIERMAIRAKIESLASTLPDVAKLNARTAKLSKLRAQMEAKLGLLKSEVKFFTDHDNCPTCKQQIDSSFSCDIVGKREADIAELEEGLNQLSEKQEQLIKELDVANVIDREIQDLRTKSSHETLRIQILNEQILSVEREIQAAEQDIVDIDTDKVSDVEKELQKLCVQYNDLQEDKAVLGAAAVLLKDGGIKTKIVNQYIPIINKLINKYLSEFDLFVEFNLDEQFNEVIKSRHRDVFSYASFSEGEKSRIDLAILFAWRAVAKLRNSLNTNLLILDEVFDGSLDGSAADDLYKILQTISRDSCVFVISHKESMQDKFDNMIKFVKHKNFSTAT